MLSNETVLFACVQLPYDAKFKLLIKLMNQGWENFDKFHQYLPF